MKVETLFPVACDLTSQPLRHVFHNPERSGRLAKWALEMGEHKIEFQWPSAKKAQVIADFLADYPSKTEEKEPPELLVILEKPIVKRMPADPIPMELEAVMPSEAVFAQ